MKSTRDINKTQSKQNKSDLLKKINRWIYLILSVVCFIIFIALLIVIGSNSNYYFNSQKSSDLALIGTCSGSLVFGVIFLIVHFKQKKKLN